MDIKDFTWRPGEYTQSPHLLFYNPTGQLTAKVAINHDHLYEASICAFRPSKQLGEFDTLANARKAVEEYICRAQQHSNLQKNSTP